MRVILFSGYFILLLSLFACSKQEKPAVLGKSETDLPDQESWGNTFEVTVENKPRAVIWSGYYAKYGKKREVFFADSIHIDFYNEEGIHQSELFADSGKVFENTNDIHAW
jgi:hypothetical protein